MRKIFWASDSTVQTNKFMTHPQTGIGAGIFLVYKRRCNSIKLCQKWKKYQELY